MDPGSALLGGRYDLCGVGSVDDEDVRNRRAPLQCFRDYDVAFGEEGALPIADGAPPKLASVLNALVPG